VSASGFSKEIQEFDKLLVEMNKEAEEDARNEAACGDNDANNNNDESNCQEDEFDDQEEEEKYVRSIVNCEKASSPKTSNSQETNKNKSEVEAGSVCDASGGDEVPLAEGEEYDKFDDTMLNKQYRPYRDPNAQGEDGENGSEDDDDDGLSVGSCTSTIMDPKMVRSKVKQSLLRKMKTEKRRIRNKGESALVTDRNREVNDEIKSNFGFF
jgi:hypothetical protein